MHNHKGLGGVVKGRKRTYRIEVDIQQPPYGEVRIDPIYEVSVFDDDTGKLVKKESVEVPGDSRETLRIFVDATKYSAETDFM
jgi:hypothetical protein